MNPPVNGWGDSTTGVALAAVATSQPVATADQGGIPRTAAALGANISDLGVGLVLAVLILAYWFRRIL